MRTAANIGSSYVEPAPAVTSIGKNSLTLILLACSSTLTVNSRVALASPYVSVAVSVTLRSPRPYSGMCTVPSVLIQRSSLVCQLTAEPFLPSVGRFRSNSTVPVLPM